MLEVKTIDSQTLTRQTRINKAHKTKLNVSRIVTAGVSGLAGGAAVTIFFAGGAIGLPIAIAGSLAGAAITGGAEYSREKRQHSLR